MENVPCPLCDVDDARTVFQRRDLTYLVSQEEFHVVRCRRCGLVYVNPRPTEEEIHSFYTEEFYKTDADPSQLLLEKERELLLKYGYVKKLKPGKLLDIGCQKGEFMFFMKQRGWDVHGVEFSSTPPNLFGLDIRYCDLGSAGYDPSGFDLVTLWAVLEHVYGPKEMLSEVNRLLKPGGKIVLLVTNFNSIPGRFMRHDDIPRHTTLFTERTIRRMLRLTGFEPDRARFDCELFGGRNRGVLNYLVKLAAGEKIDDIVSQNRCAGRWGEFAGQLRGRESSRMLKIDRLDIRLTPHLDRWLDWLQLGFIMIVTATKRWEPAAIPDGMGTNLERE
jgi:SAM-dependent methyltransferase